MASIPVLHAGEGWGIAAKRAEIVSIIAGIMS
jgi:hypothetical protein